MNNPKNTMLRAIEAGDFNAAIIVYNSDIKGNTNDEQNIKNELSNKITSTFEDYKSNKIEYTKALGIIEAIIKMKLVDSLGEEIKGEIISLEDSKIAYAKGMEFYNSKNTIGAITELSKVISTDPKYAESQQLIKSMYESYKSEIIKQCDEYIDKQEYEKAISTINEALLVLPDDAGFIAKLENYKTMNIEKLMSEQQLSVESASLYVYGYYINFYGINAIVKNNTPDKVVKQFSIGMLAYDKDGYPLIIDSPDVLKQGYAENCNIKPGATYGKDTYWSLYNDNEDKIKTVLACVIDVKYYDDTEWENPYYQYWLAQYEDKPLQ